MNLACVLYRKEQIQMPQELSDLIALVKTEYNAAYGTGSSVGYRLRTTAEQLEWENFDEAANQIYMAGTFMYAFTEDILTRYTHQNYRLTRVLEWIEDNWPTAGDPYELTMSSIIIAMYGANRQEYTDFVGIEDAYRQALWNQPFNKAYFAELARGFAEWE